MWPDRRSWLYALAGTGLALVLVLLMAPSGGFPSRPTFQTVRAIGEGGGADPNFIARNNNPNLELRELDGAADNERWAFTVSGEQFRLRMLTDSGGLVANIFTVDRTAQVVDNVTINGRIVAAPLVGGVSMGLVASDSGGDNWVGFYETAPFGTRKGFLGYANASSDGFSITNEEVDAALDLSTTGVGPVRVNGVGIDSSLFVRKTATTSRASTTTATDDPHLTVSLASGVVYQVQGYLLVDSTSATPDFKFQFTRPTNTNSFVTYDTIEQAVGVIAASANNGTYGSIFTVPLTVNNDHAIQLNGIFESTASGTFAISWAQNTSDVAATNLLAGSWIRLSRVN